MVFLWFSLMFKNKSSRKARAFLSVDRGPSISAPPEVALIVLLLGHGAYWFHGDFPMENPKLKRMMTWENPP